MIFYQDKDLRLASCIHATAKSEAEAIRALGYRNPIAVIPNGINLDEYPNYNKKTKNKRKVLFLSRIHKKKGIENLINAWKELDRVTTQNWEVEVVGDGDEKYIANLKHLINHLNLGESIKINKAVYGVEKIEKYREANLFVLPTHSENFGIVIAEALASKTPVITTKGTPWEELNTHNCGEWIDIGKLPLKESLSKMLIKKDKELFEMGERGRQLIKEKYSMNAVAKDMNLLYKWLLDENEKPKFVNID
jgi:glycosyltransferase involved in cell wall biosynthesis